jgi:hypothetical protein
VKIQPQWVVTPGKQQQQYNKAPNTALYWFFPCIYILFDGEKMIFHVVSFF